MRRNECRTFSSALGSWKVVLLRVSASVLALITVILVAGATSIAAAGPGTTERISVNSLEAEANADSVADGNISADGRYVVFRSDASNLVSGDTNGVDREVYVRDRIAGTTDRVSVGTGGTEANGDSDSPWMSGDGRYVVFRSVATNLVSDDTNGTVDIFLHDRASTTTQRVSVAYDGSEANSSSVCPRISGDGQVVVFSSTASNLVPGDPDGFGADTFVRDLQAGTTELIAQGTHPCDSISSDGRFVAFFSQASNIVPGDTNGTYDVFVYDRQTDVVERVSVDSTGGQANGFNIDPSINGDGRLITFYSSAENLVVGDTNGQLDIFVHDRQSGSTERVSVDSGGGQSNAGSSLPSISADGTSVTFTSSASNLVPGDTNNRQDVFVHDRLTGTTDRVSVDSAGAGGQSDSGFGTSTLTANGEVVAFDSEASNLVPGDTGCCIDVFVHQRVGAVSSVPDPPSAPVATAGNGSADVSWSAPNDGGSPITGYTVTASPGGQSTTVNGSTLTAVVSGLTNCTAYTFTVQATNANGTSQASAASNEVRPRTTATVAVEDTRYNPQVVGIKTEQCVEVTFTFAASKANKRPHSVTEFNLLGPGATPLFDSGLVSPGGNPFVRFFIGATAYSYHSTGKNDVYTGAVRTPVIVSPSSGSTTTSFTVRWAPDPLPNFVFDLQYRFLSKAGKLGNWTDWLQDQAGAKGTFVPPSLAPGKYEFRARIQNALTGKQGGYSLFDESTKFDCVCTILVT